MLEKELSEELRAYIHGTGWPDFPHGFTFYPNLHTKLYLSDKMLYIGSTNLTTGAGVNAEAGITTRNRKAMKTAATYFYALACEGFCLEGMSLPDSKRHLVYPDD
jgi:hypothetical protein